MTQRWTEHEIEKMLDYREEGLTEPKIAERLTLIFMRRFTEDSVNRKVRDLKKAGYIDKNGRTGPWSNFLGRKRKKVVVE
jgi:hypothetical protein